MSTRSARIVSLFLSWCCAVGSANAGSSTLRTFSRNGTCSAGTCDYPYQEVRGSRGSIRSHGPGYVIAFTKEQPDGFMVQFVHYGCGSGPLP